jgi:hypothetical protein
MTDQRNPLFDYCARCYHPLSDADTCTMRFPHCMGKPLPIPQVIAAMNAEYVVEEDLAAFAWALRDEVQRLQAEVDRLQTENIHLQAESIRVRVDNDALRAQRDAYPRPTEWVLTYRIERMDDTEESPWRTEEFYTLDDALNWVAIDRNLKHVEIRKRDDGSYGGGALGGGKMVTVTVTRKEQ